MRTHKFMAVWRRPPRVVAVIATCALVAAGIVLPSSSAFAAAGCSVQYSKAWDNGSGFGANVAITNTGDPIANGWTLEFDFPGNQRITDLWPVAFTQPAGSAHVTISSNADWNKAIATGATFTPGFNGNYSGANANPTSFKLNGTTCGGAAPTLVVSPASVSVPEGGMVTFAVRLSAAPTANVTVTSARSAGDTDVTVSAGGTLTFTPANFATPQNVTVSAAEDADTINGAATITVSATGSIPSVAVAATEADNDPGQAIVVSPTALSVPEGGTATFGVRLQNAPAANVTRHLRRRLQRGHRPHRGLGHRHEDVHLDQLRHGAERHGRGGRGRRHDQRHPRHQLYRQRGSPPSRSPRPRRTTTRASRRSWSPRPA